MWIGLALLSNGRARHGEIVQVWDGLRGMTVMGEICDPMHFDKENKRLHA
jgi:sarcosine oxidase subunit alpha